MAVVGFMLAMVTIAGRMDRDDKTDPASRARGGAEHAGRRDNSETATSARSVGVTWPSGAPARQPEPPPGWLHTYRCVGKSADHFAEVAQLSLAADTLWLRRGGCLRGGMTMACRPKGKFGEITRTHSPTVDIDPKPSAPQRRVDH